MPAPEAPGDSGTIATNRGPVSFDEIVVADQALLRAKGTGRNRVLVAGQPDADVENRT